VYYVVLVYIYIVAGNVLAIVILTKVRPITSPSVFMIALGVVDSLNLIIKYIITDVHTHGRPITDIGCRLLTPFLTTWMMKYSNWLVVAMTVERFIAVRFPLRIVSICSRKKSAMTVAAIGVTLGLINVHYIPFRHASADTYRLRNTTQMKCKAYDEFTYWHDEIWP
jgi:hypothetical protein